ncbi:uncharacterized protein LOC112045498 [Bicyclus anynana]|uniref:Uncharacterized protein LOC112045498 n=1 Tax=Bicyclus anynana TaxID=110368 RepID=A0A6J1N3I3_BICAN|nr:uncharacterized protein LOC112045498 [Bicyclus anynana]
MEICSTSPAYTDEEFADMLQCYIDSGKKIELTQMYYINRYPDRREPKLKTLEEVVQKYLKNDDSNDTASSQMETKNCSIINYFKNNTHATSKKAASIFNVNSSYIDKLVEERKAELREKQNVRITQKEKRFNYDEKIDKHDSSDSDAPLMDIVEDVGDFDIIAETPVITISETSNRDTSDDLEYYETKKRKKKRKKTKYSKGSQKKLRISENNEENMENILETFQNQIPIIYTTRLEEMAISYKNLQYVHNARVLQDILLQSKPKYKGHVSNIQLTKVRFKLLEEVLNKLKKSETFNIQKKQTTQNVGNDNNVSKVIVSSLINPKERTINSGQSADIGWSKNCNVIIEMNNLFSNIRDIYVINSKGNLIEYCCTKTSDRKKQFDRSKFRWTLDLCCWFQRQHKIESIWPRDEYPFSRFLTTTHTCRPGRCICCCKPQATTQTTETIFCKPTCTLQSSDNFLKEYFNISNENNTSLISRALRYEKQEDNKNINTVYHSKQYFKSPINTQQQFLLIEPVNNVEKNKVSHEFCELDQNKELSYYRVEICCKNTYLSIYGNNLRRAFCCSWNRNYCLYGEYKQSSITAGTFRFLKKALAPHNTCYQCKAGSINKNTHLTTNVPKIEHSRPSVKSTLLKIGKSTQKSTVNINARCLEEPGFLMEIKNVDINVATVVVNRIREMSLTVKEDRKLLATLKSSLDITSGEDFGIITQLLQNIQKYLPCIPAMVPGTAIHLIVEIDNVSQRLHNLGLNVACNTKQTKNYVSSIDTSDISNCNKQTSTGSLKTNEGRGKIPNKANDVSNRTENNSPSFETSNVSNADKQTSTGSLKTKGGRGKIRNKANDVSNRTENNSPSFETSNVSNADKQTSTGSLKTKGGRGKIRNKANDVSNRTENDSPSFETSDVSNADKQTSTSSLKTKKGRGRIRNKVNHVSNRTDNDVPSFETSDVSYADKQTSTDSLTAIGSGPTRSNENDIVIPNKMEAYNNFAKNIKCSKKCYMDSFKSHLKHAKGDDDDMSLPKVASVFSLQDLTKNNELVSPVGLTVQDPLSIKPAQFLTTPQESRSDLAKSSTDSCIILIPVHNQLNPNTFSGVSHHLSYFQTLTPINKSIIPSKLPDIINDIPKNINGTEYTVVKDERDNEVVLLDSD